MREFFATAFAFPTVVLTVPFLLMMVLWLAALVGLADLEALEGFGGLTAAAGAVKLHGVPLVIPLSVLLATSWFATLSGAVLLDVWDLPGWGLVLAGLLVIAIALLAGWAVTAFITVGLRRILRPERPDSRQDFVGRVCVVRTGRADEGFGQGEVSAEDGSTSVIQIRTTGGESLASGDSALIFDYDTDGEFFRVTPYDASLDPDLRQE
jgi:membrane protein implicated in regulation of membrane protease activity